MKFKDFFTRIKENGKINNPDFDKFLESVAEGEFPDALLPEFENNFLTIDRAAAHPSVNKKLRKEILDPVDNHLNSILSAIEAQDKYTAMELSKNVRTTDAGKTVLESYKMIEAMSKALPDLFKKASSTKTDDEELKRQIKSKDQAIADLTAKFEQSANEFQAKEKGFKSEYENKLKDYRLNAYLEKLANGYTFADVFTEAREDLTKAKLDAIKRSNVLSLVESNGKDDIQVMEMDPDSGNPKPKFNGNTPVTIKSLMDDAFKTYIKQNNGGQQPANGGTRDNPRQYPTNDGKAPRTGRSTSVV